MRPRAIVPRQCRDGDAVRQGKVARGRCAGARGEKCRARFLFEMLKPSAAGQPLDAGLEASEGMCNLCFRVHIGELKSG